MEHLQPTSPQSISDPSISTPKKTKRKVTFNANASYRNIVNWPTIMLKKVVNLVFKFNY